MGQGATGSVRGGHVSESRRRPRLHSLTSANELFFPSNRTKHIASMNEKSEPLAEIAKNVVIILTSLVVSCMYSWITVATTEDAQLVPSSAVVALPIVQAQIPIAWFYRVMPLILVGLFLYLHLSLQMLWGRIASSGDTLSTWPLNRLADEAFRCRRLFRALRGLLSCSPITKRPATTLERAHSGAPLLRIGDVVLIFLVWWLTPATLTLLWARYLPLHEWVGTLIDMGLIALSGAIGLRSYSFMQNISQLAESYASRNDRRAQAAFLVLIVIFGLFSCGAINGKKHCTETDIAENNVAQEVEACWTNPRTWVPFLFSWVHYDPFADFSFASVAQKPENWWTADDVTDVIKSVDLQKKDLRELSASSAFLINANFRGADLRGADFSKADLRGAQFDCAGIRGGFLRRAQPTGCMRLLTPNDEIKCTRLEHANFNRAKMVDADLTGANLQMSDFGRADLSTADLSCANLRNSYLKRVNLGHVTLDGTSFIGATFDQTDLSGVDLSKVENTEMTVSQLQAACADGLDPPKNLPDWARGTKFLQCKRPEDGGPPRRRKPPLQEE
jgi:uncharacterized protein YjbI with pentapeptide repeats